MIGQSEQTIALLVCLCTKMKVKVFFFWIFFNNLNAKTAAMTSSFSKLSKSESIFVFLPVSLLA